MRQEAAPTTALLALLAIVVGSCGGEAGVQVISSGGGSPTRPGTTVTPTRLVTQGATHTATPNTTGEPSTRTPTASRTPTSSPAPSATGPQPTRTHTATPSATVDGADTPTERPTRTSTSGATLTATPIVTATPSMVAQATPTNTASPTTVPTVTSTSGPTSPPTVTETPGEAGPVCGNGFLETGENYDDPTVGLVGDPVGDPCPQDATVEPCTPTDERAVFNVLFTSPTGSTPSSVTVLVGYSSNLVSLPGSGSEITVRQRLSTPPPPPFVQTPYDLNYALRFIMARTSSILDGVLFTISFDTCSGAPPPTANEFGCIIEGCAGAGGLVEGCTCRVAGSMMR